MNASTEPSQVRLSPAALTNVAPLCASYEKEREAISHSYEAAVI
jgi:hypothetical protein